MDLPGDDRSQSVLIGSILLFGFVVIALSSYQAYVIPQENSQVEFDHNQKAQSQMQDLRSSVIRTSGMGTQQSTSVSLGTRYPSRTILLNPSPPSGTLRTTAEHSVVIRNAQADGETGDYWNANPRTFNTRPIRFQPGYNVYDEAPTTNIEHGVVYNDFDDALLTKSDQPIVSGRTLTFVFVDGEYRKSTSDSVTVDTEPVSTSTNRIAVENTTNRIEIDLETKIPEEVWVSELLADQIDGADGSQTDCSDVGTATDDDDNRYIQDCQFDDTTDPNTLTLILEAGETYNLRLSKVGVGSDISEPTTTYVTDIEGDGATIPDGGEQRLVAEVRDEYDNPVSGVNACAAVTGNPTLGTIEEVPPTDTSGEDGHASYTFQANDGVSGEAEITVSYSCDVNNIPNPTDDTEDSTFNVTVYDTGGGGGNAAGNVQAVDGSTPTGESTALEFDIENTGSNDVTVTDFSISTPGNENSNAQQLNEIDRPLGQDEVEIGMGSANADSPPTSGSYNTDGTQYTMDTNALIGGGSTVSANMGEFNDGNLGLTYELTSDASKADITVEFTFDDGSSTEFYFRVTNVNP